MIEIKLITEIRKKIDLSASLCREGKVAQAASILNISIDSIDAELFMNKFLPIERALSALDNGDFISAKKLFLSSGDIASKIGSNEIREFILLQFNVSCGIASLLEGNASNATNFLQEASERADALSTRFPEMEFFCLYIRSMWVASTCNYYLSRGDVEAAKPHVALLYDSHIRIRSHMDANNIHKDGMNFELSSTSLEAYMAISVIDAANWRFDEIKKRIPFIEETLSDVLKYLSTASDPSVKGAMEATIMAAKALLLISKGHDGIKNKSYQSSITHFINARELLGVATNISLRSGVRAQTPMRTASILDNIARGFIDIIKPRTVDAISMSGIAFCIIFIAVNALVYAIIRPLEHDWPDYYKINAIISLIGAFGYGALKFLPVFRMLGKVKQS